MKIPYINRDSIPSSFTICLCCNLNELLLYFLISVCFFNINTQGYQRFTVTTNYVGCAVLKMLAKDPMECAKLVGVILMHFGQLRAYGQGKPAVIKVNKPGLCAHFNAWHSKRMSVRDR